MKIKQFQGKDSRAAMAKVRAELGPEAVILSNKTVNGQVELVAAVDLDETLLKEEAKQKVPAPIKSPQTPEPESSTLQELQREMGNLRNILETELSQLAWRDMASKPAVHTALFNRLTKLGLSRQLSGELLENVATSGDLRALWIKTLRHLSSKLSVMGDSMLDNGGVVALVGSTGVGKTTTIAKLAARYIMRHGPREVALITTDCFRIGGQEQLETFAGYLGIPMLVATNGEELKDALDKFSSRKLVLIDTAGMSQRDVRLYEQFATLNSTGYQVESYAVLSATSMQGSIQEVIKTFGASALAGAIITKVDESTCLGGVLDTVIRNELSISYVNTGQKVPEDIMPARAENLVAKAVDLAEIDTCIQGDPSAEYTTHSMAG